MNRRAFLQTLALPAAFAQQKRPPDKPKEDIGKDHYESLRKDLHTAELRNDRLGILKKVELQTDSSREMVTIPADYPYKIDFDVAKEPPAVHFGVIQGFQPWNLVPRKERLGGVYGGWGDVVRGPDGCFYFAIGNHFSYGGNAWIVRYDPRARRQSLVLETKKLIGWGDDQWSDGKMIHGDPDIGPGGDMWTTTFSGPLPRWEKGWLAAPYRGGHVLRHNIFTGEAEDLGIPLEGATYKMSGYDWVHGVLFGASQGRGYVMAYDTGARRLLYGGMPPDGIYWYCLGTLADRDTGRFYSTDTEIDDHGGPTGRGTNKFVYWERAKNVFARMKAEPPPHPVTGKKSQMRAYTKRKDASGAFWCSTYDGMLFRFFPELDRTEPVGLNWAEGKYTTNFCLSPGNRYLYYAPGANGCCKWGTPLVQFDTQTRRRKVIAFLNEFYLNKYGYSPYGVYGLELDAQGESLVLYANGQFTTKKDGSGYGRPAIYHIEIPASERAE